MAYTIAATRMIVTHMNAQDHGKMIFTVVSMIFLVVLIISAYMIRGNTVEISKESV